MVQCKALLHNAAFYETDLFQKAVYPCVDFYSLAGLSMAYVVAVEGDIFVDGRCEHNAHRLFYRGGLFAGSEGQ